ncbi:MAG: TolC family protein [Holophagales bacterium]|nr:TolC family protein [Holophagales bacterium]
MSILWSRRGVALCALLAVAAFKTQGVEPPPPLDRAEVERLVEEALEANPEIRSARATAASAEARIKPAGTLPDPMVSVSYENDGVSPSLGTMEMTRLQFMAQQAIPYPGKLRLAREVAQKDAERAGTVPQRVVLTIGASVRRAYADLLEAREALRLVDEQAETWKGIEEVTRGRYAAGLASQQDVLRAQSERTRLLQERRREEAAELTALSELRQLLFRPPDAPIPTEQRLTPGRLVTIPSSAETLARAVDETPELKEIALVRERSELSVDLARRNLRPDFVASAAYMNRGGSRSCGPPASASRSLSGPARSSGRSSWRPRPSPRRQPPQRSPSVAECRLQLRNASSASTSSPRKRGSTPRGSSCRTNSPSMPPLPATGPAPSPS